jgi:hypothetical protein
LGRDYAAAIERLHGLGVMVNGSFVFGRTVDWAVGHGIETATFHILTPYPGTELYARMRKADRIVHSDWDLHDTRHVVYRPAKLSPDALEEGYWRAYKEFYRWGNILRGASTKPTLRDGVRHVAYSGGWKKLERTHQSSKLPPTLSSILSRRSSSASNVPWIYYLKVPPQCVLGSPLQRWRRLTITTILVPASSRSKTFSSTAMFLF